MFYSHRACSPSGQSTSLVFHKENLKQFPRFSSIPPDLHMKVTFNQTIPLELEYPKKYFEEGKKPFFNLCNLRSPGKREKSREVPNKTESTGKRRAGRVVENRVILKIFKHTSLPGKCRWTGRPHQDLLGWVL